QESSKARAQQWFYTTSESMPSSTEHGYLGVDAYRKFLQVHSLQRAARSSKGLRGVLRQVCW
ncbi:MAG TPA: hypothetical protein VFE98_09230, partial [Candidatus Bathyarchaeia archaeon]|nr:hypothetical protein [Candidatus Bathyarchaeia archaeon]